MNEKMLDLDHLNEATLRARRTMKWSGYAENVLPAWVAEMDFPTADVVKEAVLDAARREEYGYPVHDAETGLPDAVAAWSKAHYDQVVDPNRVHILPDVLKGVELAIEFFSPEGSPVILPTPAYMPFFMVPGTVRREIIEVPMHHHDDGTYALDLDGIGAAFEQGGGTVILCQPYNPVGKQFTADEMRALAEVVDAHGGRVISDEIHAPLTYDTPHIPYASVSEVAAGHSLSMTSASKAWNLPGLKCAVAIVNNDDDETTWQAISMMRTHGASTMGIEANVAAFTRGEPWLEEVRAYLDTTRTWFADLLSDRLPGVRYVPPEATYFAWLDCRALNLPTEPAEWFLEHAAVMVNPGPPFGAVADGFVRLNLATSRPILERIVDAMAASLPR